MSDLQQLCWSILFTDRLVLTKYFSFTLIEMYIICKQCFCHRFAIGALKIRKAIFLG